MVGQKCTAKPRDMCPLKEWALQIQGFEFDSKLLRYANVKWILPKITKYVDYG